MANETVVTMAELHVLLSTLERTLAVANWDGFTEQARRDVLTAVFKRMASVPLRVDVTPVAESVSQ